MSSDDSRISRRPKKARSPPQQEIVLDDMPFISFGQPGQDSDGEKQKIIRKHLGRRRKKLTPQRDASKKITKKDSNPDSISALCSCFPEPDLHTAASERRTMSLELCPGCGRPRLVESVTSASVSLVSSPEVGSSSMFASPTIGSSSMFSSPVATSSPVWVSPRVGSFSPTEFNPVTASLWGNSSDPFGMLPIESDIKAHSLVKHFINVTAPSTLPIPEFAAMFPNVSAAINLMAHEETLLQSVLSLAAMHLEWLRGNRNLSAATLEERGKAISLLNRNLTAPSDGLIIAIGILGACEMVAGNFESWQAHVLGLRNLIQMRGGLGPHDIIRDAILECDAVGASIFGVQPYMTAYVDLEDVPSYDGQMSLPYEFISIDSQLRQTFVAIRALAATTESFILSRSRKRGQQAEFLPTVDKAALRDYVAKRSVIEYRLLTLHSGDQDASADEDEAGGLFDDSDPATTVLSLGAKIFTNLVFRKMHPASLIHANLAIRLREAILAFDQHPSSQYATCLLLWASVLGAIASRDGALRTWFLGWVNHCCSELDICQESDLKYQLQKVAWIDVVLGSLCGQVWREMENLNRMGVEVRFVSETQ